MPSEFVGTVFFVKEFCFKYKNKKNQKTQIVFTHFVHRCMLAVSSVSAVIGEQLVLKSHISIFRLNACLAPAKVFEVFESVWASARPTGFFIRSPLRTR